MPQSLENQRVGRGSVEIRALSPLLSSGIDHLERAVLPSTALDGHYAPLRRDAVPMPRVPLQFRQFPSLQGETQLAGRRG